ncbi:hypothetical protein [Streptomyces sp. NBC_00286]|uniref:hypothetical protein n=1 Tax=Streptomyces sp. NBC_00286 TaxID=2975701 RepID=UPI002E2B73B5|nr:hypothetical protein [Streptomyces sp. NBC_00286]
MTAAAVTLASIAATLEIWGIWWTIVDIRRARNRLAAYLGRPRRVYASGTMVVEAAFRITATGPQQTLEQRIEALETCRHSLAEELHRSDKKLYGRLVERFQRELSASEKSLDYKLEGVREFVAGDGQSHWVLAYRGPIVLGVGVVVGLAANIVSSLPSS